MNYSIMQKKKEKAAEANCPECPLFKMLEQIVQEQNELIMVQKEQLRRHKLERLKRYQMDCHLNYN